MIASVLTDNFAIPAKGLAKHKIGVSFTISEGNGTYKKRVKIGSTWSSWEDITLESKYNINGFYIQFFLEQGSYEFELKDMIDNSVWSSGVYSLTSKNHLSGLPISNSPIYNIQTLQTGTNVLLSLKTVNPKTLVKLYKRSSTGQYDNFTVENFTISSDTQENDGFYIANIIIASVLSTDRFCVSATEAFAFESFSNNEIQPTVDISAKNVKYKVVYRNILDEGKEVKLQLSGGSGNYSISLDNSTFDKSNDTFFTIPFGKVTLYVKDVGNNLISTVNVDGGLIQNNQLTQEDLSLRNHFSTTQNNYKNYKNGWLDSQNIFFEFDSYALRDGRNSWGISTYDFPQISLTDNTTMISGGTMPSDMILMHPSASEGGAQNAGNKSPIRRYTFQNDGKLKDFFLKARKVGPNQNTSLPAPYPTCYVRLRVMLNYQTIYTKLFTVQDQYEEFTLTEEINVYKSDTLDIVVDSADETDQKSPDFDHLWVGYTAKYIYGNKNINTSVNKINISSSLFINVNEEIIGYKDLEEGIYLPIVTVFKDSYPYSITKYSAESNGILPFVYLPQKNGDYQFLNSISRSISNYVIYIYSQLSSIVSVSPETNVLATITLSNTANKITLGEEIRGKTNLIDNIINVYLEDLKIKTITPFEILGTAFWVFVPEAITSNKGFCFSATNAVSGIESSKTQYITVVNQSLDGYTYTVSANFTNCSNKIIQFAILPESGLIKDIESNAWVDSLLGNFNLEGKLTPLSGEQRQYQKFKTNSDTSKFAYRQKDDITNIGILP